jgi:hypothetical protein
LHHRKLDTDLGDSEVASAIAAQRHHHIHRIRTVGDAVFGFESKYFATEYDRSEVPEFGILLGVKDTPKGRRYPMLPPILYPNGSDADPKQLFLNPALIKASAHSISHFCVVC